MTRPFKIEPRPVRPRFNTGVFIALVLVTLAALSGHPAPENPPVIHLKNSEPRAPQPTHYEDMRRVRAAADRAPIVLPAAIGELVSRELNAVATLPYLPRPGSMLNRVLADVEALPLPARLVA